MPRLMLGADGLWMLQTLSAYLPEKMNPFPRVEIVPAWERPQEGGSTP